MTHGELFWFSLFIWMAIPRSNTLWDFFGKSGLFIMACYNFVLWIIDTAHPTIIHLG